MEMKNAEDYMKRALFLKSCLDKGLSENTLKTLSSRIRDAENPEKLAEEYTALIEKSKTEEDIIKELNL